uniref:Uncharacterized protein n=1 Tax=Chrysotila carterae TaxID=13221 RepID=A0A7S4ETY7_CHRCT
MQRHVYAWCQYLCVRAQAKKCRSSMMGAPWRLCLFNDCCLATGVQINLTLLEVVHFARSADSITKGGRSNSMESMHSRCASSPCEPDLPDTLAGLHGLPACTSAMCAVWETCKREVDQSGAVSDVDSEMASLANASALRESLGVELRENLDLRLLARRLEVSCAHVRPHLSCSRVKALLARMQHMRLPRFVTSTAAVSQPNRVGMSRREAFVQNVGARTAACLTASNGFEILLDALWDRVIEYTPAELHRHAALAHEAGRRGLVVGVRPSMSGPPAWLCVASESRVGFGSCTPPPRSYVRALRCRAGARAHAKRYLTWCAENFTRHLYSCNAVMRAWTTGFLEARELPSRARDSFRARRNVTEKTGRFRVLGS